MLTVSLACLALLALTTLLHYEVLQSLHQRLGRLRIPVRSKLLVVMFSAFSAHALEMLLYGAAYFVLLKVGGVGALSGPHLLSLHDCLYFSAATYTSLGFGDIAPLGPIRMLAGTEALNGLLLIGWTASFAYIAMERFWSLPGAHR
jgi:hypothetical protein